MNKQNSAPASIFSFVLSAASKESFGTLLSEIRALQRDFETLPESQRLLLQPFLERFLHLLSDLSKDLVFVEGSAHVEATSLHDQDDVSLQAYSRMIEEPQGVFVLTRGWNKAEVKKFHRDLGRLLTTYCQPKNEDEEA